MHGEMTSPGVNALEACWKIAARSIAHAACGDNSALRLSEQCAIRENVYNRPVVSPDRMGY